MKNWKASLLPVIHTSRRRSSIKYLFFSNFLKFSTYVLFQQNILTKSIAHVALTMTNNSRKSVTSFKNYNSGSRSFSKLKNRCQISLLILHEFKRIN